MTKDEAPKTEKQYYVLIDYKEDGWKKRWKKGQIIFLSPEEAQAFVGSKVITPLRTALQKGQYVPKTEIATYTKPKLKPSEKVEELKKEKPKKKTLIKNSLRTAVQEKKEIVDEPIPEEESPKKSDEKIEEPKTEPKKPSSSSAAEDAIKAKIAAAKEKKK